MHAHSLARRRGASRLVALAAGLAGALIAQEPAITVAADHNDPIHVQANYQSGEISGYVVNTGDPSADLADVFAWYTGEPGHAESLVLALTWRVDPLEEKEKSFDPTVAYGVHIATGDPGLLDLDLSNPLKPSVTSKLDTEPTYSIITWFGESRETPGKWGMRVSGLPSAEPTVVGAVGKTLTTSDGVRIASGLFDDAFFADLDGFFNAVYVALRNGADSPNPSLPPSRYTHLNPKTGEGGELLERPFGYPEVPLDGFGHQNVHAIVVEIPIALLGGETKFHVWGTTERVKGLPKSGADLACASSREGATDSYRCEETTP
jgi:hypothetical protein